MLDSSFLMKALQEKRLSPMLARKILRDVLDGKTTVRKELSELSAENPAQLDFIVKQVLSQQASIVAAYKAGKKNAFNFLLGEVLKTAKHKAQPSEARKALEKALGQY